MVRYEQLTLERLCIQCHGIAEWTQETIDGPEHYCRACYKQLGEEPTDGRHSLFSQRRDGSSHQQ